MRPSATRFLPLAVLLLGAVVLLACPKSAEQKALELRSRYTLETRSWQVREASPLAQAAAVDAALSAHATATDAMAAAADGGDPADVPVIPSAPAGPRRVEASFEVRIVRRGEAGLSGITLDVTQSDPFQQVKKVYRHYLELPAAADGEPRDLSFAVLADDFVDGDVFAATLAAEVPPEARGAYRELR